MKLSAAGRAALIQFEGYRDFPYNDSENYATIGVGHLLHKSPVTAADRAKYRGWTRSDTLRLFAQDCAPREKYLTSLLKRPANQNEFDAMLSLMFNIGNAGFAGSTVLREFNKGNRKAAANAFLMWVHPPELRGRRERERARFLAPVKKVDKLKGLTATERRWANQRLNAEHLIHVKHVKGSMLKGAEADSVEARKWLRDHQRQLWLDAGKGKNWKTDNRGGRWQIIDAVVEGRIRK